MNHLSSTARRFDWPHRLHLLFRLPGLLTLAACAGVETGAISPCHGQFHAEGKYFATRAQSDGSTVVVSTMNAPDAACGN